ncbi:MAG: hypothetical protein ABI790_02045 [Betaproteobacteria bacterium]
MDTGMVLVKTDKGHEEIEKRTNHLGFRHRTALILVDGEDTVDMLLAKIPGEGLKLLEELLRDGYVADVRGQSPGTPAESGAIAAPAGGASGTGTSAAFDLESAKFQAVKMLEAVLGPGGESLAIAIERSQTLAEFSTQAKRTRDLISQVGGQRKATEFWTKTGL